MEAFSMAGESNLVFIINELDKLIIKYKNLRYKKLNEKN